MEWFSDYQEPLLLGPFDRRRLAQRCTIRGASHARIGSRHGKAETKIAAAFAEVEGHGCARQWAGSVSAAFTAIYTGTATLISIRYAGHPSEQDAGRSNNAKTLTKQSFQAE